MVSTTVHVAFERDVDIAATLEPAQLGFPECVRLRLGYDADVVLSIEQAKQAVGALLGAIKEHERKEKAPAATGARA